MDQAGMVRRITALLLVGLLGALLLPGVATAHDRNFSTEVSLSYDGTNFTGTVSSTNSACVSGRSVTLFELQPGGGSTPAGSSVSGGGGGFTIPQPGADGQFFVSVSARNLGGGYGHSHVCSGAESSTVPAGSGVLGGSQGTGDADPLPATGAEITGFVALGLLLIAVGTVLVRRRNSSQRVSGS